MNQLNFGNDREFWYSHTGRIASVENAKRPKRDQAESVYLLAVLIVYRLDVITIVI
jgi:hypothetical protein